MKRIIEMRIKQIRELCGVKRRVNERIHKRILRSFGHLEMMDGSRLLKRTY